MDNDTANGCLVIFAVFAALTAVGTGFLVYAHMTGSPVAYAIGLACCVPVFLLAVCIVA